MASSIRNWSARKATVRGHTQWQVVNGGREPVAIVYTSGRDAALMADAPKLLSELKHMVAIVRLREGELRVSAKSALDRSRTLIAAH